MSKKRLRNNANIFEIFLAQSRCYNGRVSGFASSLIAKLGEAQKTDESRANILTSIEDMLCIGLSTDSDLVGLWYKKSRDGNPPLAATQKHIATIVALNQIARAQGIFHQLNQDTQTMQANTGWTAHDRHCFMNQYAAKNLDRMTIVVDAAANAWKNDPKVNPSENSMAWAQTLVSQFAHARTSPDDARYHALRNDAGLYLSEKIIDNVRRIWDLPTQTGP